MKLTMSSQSHKKGTAATLGAACGQGICGPPQPSNAHLLLLSWYSVSSIDLHTNFGVHAAAWSYFPHF